MNKERISRDALKKMVEYMLLSDRKYGVRLDIYVTEEYDTDYEKVIGYKLAYIQNDLGLEFVGPAKCLLPFWMIDKHEEEKENIRKELDDKNISYTEKDIEEKWFDQLEIKLDKQIAYLKELFLNKR